MHEGEPLTEEVLPAILKANPKKLIFLDPYIQQSLDDDKKTASSDQALALIYRKLRSTDKANRSAMEEFFKNLYFNPETYNLSKVGRFLVNKKLELQRPENDVVLHPEEIVLTLKRLLDVVANPNVLDDKDHLANKRVKTPGAPD